MQQSPHEIKEQLLGALDKDYNVVDMDTVIYVITVLEKITITKDALEKTRLGRYINELRKRTSNENLARRAKDLVKSWRKLIPQTEHVVNGERVAGGITPPGPGPGGKPSSPAFGKTSIRSLVAGTPTPTSRHKPASPLVPYDRIASPLCSSASSSPLLYTVKTCTRPVTPSGYAPNKCASSSSSVHSCDSLSVPRQQNAGDRNSVAHSLTFKPVSPALAASFNKSAMPTLGPSPVACPKPHSPVVGSTNSVKLQSSSANLGKSIPKRHEGDNNVLNVRSPANSSGNVHSSLDLAKTNAANKRLRKEPTNCSNQHHKKPKISSPVNSSLTTVNGMDCTTAKNQVDGSKSNACSVLQSVNSEDCSQDSNSAIDNSHVRTKKKRLKYSGVIDGCDISKDKIANSKLQKVKTTQQLIEELQAKTGTKMPLNITITSPPTVRTENCKNPTRNLPLLGSDAEMTKTKSELMDRFLKSSPDRTRSNSPLTVKMEKEHTNSKSYQAEVKEECAATFAEAISEEIEKLMSSLPSIDPNVLLCEEDEEPLPPRRSSVTEEDIQRIFSENWEHVNGVFNRSGQWREWQETAILESSNGDSLHILPYVNIDW